MQQLPVISDPANTTARHGATLRDTFSELPPTQHPDSPPPRLTPVQLQAAELLLRGCPVKKIAQKLNINRGSIHRWRSADPHFIAYLNTRLNAVTHNAAISTHRILGRALRAAELAFRDEDQFNLDDALRVLAVLRVSRFIGAPLPQDPEIVAEDLGLEG